MTTQTRYASCFNCGKVYTLTEKVAKSAWNYIEFCSQECENEDNARLVEGNGIIATAELYAKQNEQAAFTDLNKLKLDVSGTTGQALSSMMHFGNNRPKAESNGLNNDKNTNELV